MSWETPALAKKVAEILDATDAPPIDSEVRLALQRIYHRKEMFGGDGRGHITLLLRTILESDGNEDALIEPIVSAVSMAMRPEWTEKGLAWIEAFDQIRLTEILRTMRGLDLFKEENLSHHLAIVLRNRLFKVLAQAKPALKTLVKPELKPRRKLSRVPGVERNVALGLRLLALRSAIKSNREHGQQVRQQFDVETKLAIGALKVARLYGSKPDIYTRISWNALVTLSSPTLPAAVREVLERRILAGERIGAPEIRAARGALKTGKQGCQIGRMAA